MEINQLLVDAEQFVASRSVDQLESLKLLQVVVLE